MTATHSISLEEARAVVEAASILPAELQPYAMSALEVDRYRVRLWNDRPAATTSEIDEAMREEQLRCATERKRTSDAMARASEHLGLATACRSCGTPSQSLVYIGTSERERLQGGRYGVVDYLCFRCRGVVSFEYERRHADELVNGKTRSELAREFLDRKADAR